nr:exopolyphosphatase [Inmirania thermothiophila]
MPAARRTLAAVDLGSNSFHLVIARAEGGTLRVLDRLREMVQLGAGLDDDGRLRPQAEARALACLERFGQRLRTMAPGTVRAVGTNALRRARHPEGFLARAEVALGHPVEVVSGIEEARLVYLGVAHTLPDPHLRTLVVDIGGGSTELVIGEGYRPLELESLYMGCLSWSERFFPKGRIGEEAMREAELAAEVEVEGALGRLRRLGWARAVGSSGTARAALAAARALGWARGGLTAQALRRLRRSLVEAGRVEALRLPGVRPARARVLPGGIAILHAVFEVLGLEEMTVSAGAMREGILYDLLGRLHDEDARERAVAAMMRRYHVDPEQAARVEATAEALRRGVAAAWGLADPQAPRLLAWAARLHEVGLAVAHAQYHKHGAYLVAHADLAGFSRQEQEAVAALVRGHRRKFPRAVFAAFPKGERRRLERLCVLLRLAVLLHRDRAGGGPLPRPEARGRRLRLHFPPGTLARRPLTAVALEQERALLAAAGWKLAVEEG